MDLDPHVLPCLQVVRCWAHSRAQLPALENTLPFPVLQADVDLGLLILILVNVIHDLPGLGSAARLSKRLLRSHPYSVKIAGQLDRERLGMKGTVHQLPPS